ncbi:MAG: biotin--[acetyl-CoA-carboxylase] ligase [Chloroflexota bacterium]
MTKIIKLVETSSTNDVAREALRESGADRVAVIAGFQTAGRGRNKNVWLGAPGQNVYFSYGIKWGTPPPELERLVSLQGAACLAVKAALSRFAPEAFFRIKYPNDAYALSPDGKARKISGSLVEHSFLGEGCENSIIGIGINVAQTEFPVEIDAASLATLGARAIPADVAQALLEELELALGAGAGEIMNRWRRELALDGKLIAILASGEKALAEEIMPDGRLRAVAIGSGREIFIDNGDSVRYDMFAEGAAQ